MKKRLWRGSTLQSLTIIVIPLTLLLVVISLGSFQVHQNAMRSLVGDRDERSVRTAASALESEIGHRLYTIQVLAGLANSSPQADLNTILADSQPLMDSLDRGVAFITPAGKLVAAPNHGLWQSLASASEYGPMLQPMAGGSISPAFTNPLDGERIILVSAPTARAGVVAIGAFSPDRLIQDSLKNIFPAGGQIAIYVIGSDDEILFHNGPATLEGGLASHPGVAEAFTGKSGTTFVRVGKDEHVVAYSPVRPVNWAILTEESWEAISSPTLSASQIIPLVMVPALLLALLALWFGARQIVRPLQRLEAKAAKMAWGDFKQIGEPVGGIAEIRGLQNELAQMASQLQAAEQSLHSYIGAITRGQEGERLRLARELHDDTIQSLIALKQRVQLAEMTLKNNRSSPDLKQLESLIEATVDNLRRTTRALRPIYLEDLGLVAALEMLVGETEQANDLKIEIEKKGTEKRLSAEVELALYRIVQEALSNITRHAQARHANISLDFSPAALLLEIGDDGKGFEVPRTPAEFTPQGHFGILGLYERAELIGASLEIRSSGKGTQLKVTLPYPEDGS